MDAIEIRAATPDDADAVECYHDRCFTSTYSSQLLAGEFTVSGHQLVHLFVEPPVAAGSSGSGRRFAASLSLRRAGKKGASPRPR